MYLKRAVLKVLLDVRREVFVLLHALLHGDLALKLCDKFLVD
jgi:hypothetical protein